MLYFNLIAFLMYFYCLCSVALSCSAVGWSAVCDCDIFWPYSLNFSRIMGEQRFGG